MRPTGFTLIEVLIVAAIMTMLTAFLVTNFSRTRSEIPRVASAIVSDIRLAQQRAVSGTLLDGTHRCGYGIVFEADRYKVYAGPDAAADDCASDDRRFSDDRVVFESVLIGGLEFATTGDVYFVPPLPRTYLNGVTGAPDLVITVRETNAQCPAPGCRTIRINAAGQVRQQ